MQDIRLLRAVVATAVLASSLAVTTAAQSPPQGFHRTTLSDGSLDRVSAMCWLPDGRLLLAERNTGRVRVFADGALAPTPWATVPNVSTAYQLEQGLLGIAADPGFLSNGHVYVYFTAASGNENRLGRLQEQGGTVTFTLLTTPQPIPAATHHNGGRLAFGTDGALFVATGDVFATNLAPDPTSYAGKILRFLPPNLTVPSGNPLPNSAIWSLGHRNIFGLAVDPETGTLFATENGQNAMDEINRIVPGGDYGWPTHEGTEQTPDPNTVDPIAVYGPPVAPVGCTFYTGANYPAAYRGDLFVIEYGTNRLRRLTLDAARTGIAADVTFHDEPSGSGLDVSDGPDGNLWVVTNDSSAVRGADELARYEHGNAPNPGANLCATSRRILGGSITICLRGRNGDAFLSWLALRQLPTPQQTIAGPLLVPVDAVLPTQFVQADDRVYFAFEVPNNPAFVGATLHLQGLQITTASALAMTNATSLTIR